MRVRVAAPVTKRRAVSSGVDRFRVRPFRLASTPADRVKFTYIVAETDSTIRVEVGLLKERMM